MAGREHDHDAMRPAQPDVSVIIPTRNRPAAVRCVLASVEGQQFDHARLEVLVVDDGSAPPVVVETGVSEHVRVVRCEHGERSRARNHGARHAKGSVLLFIDDDLTLSPRLLATHVAAHREWAACMTVGAVRLSPELVATPFGAFRQDLESADTPLHRGLVMRRNFGTAQNMSLPRDRFIALGGFDEELVSAEDQDLALRHTAAGGTIAYLPEAVAIHHDSNADIRSYCRRVEWGAEHMVPFCERYPQLPENAERRAVNGKVDRADPASQILKKITKSGLGCSPATEGLMGLVAVLERCCPGSALLPRLYRVLIGIHLQRGFRRGWRMQSAGRATI